jgi:ribosomal-protein-alanine N-acetyltransferase
MAERKKTAAVLRGKKIFLRAPERTDFRKYLALMRSSQRAHRRFLPNLPTRKRFDEFFVDCWQGEEARSFLICRKPDGAIVGSIGIFQIVRRNTKTAFSGYSIGASHLRQGYATEALQLVLRFAFKKLKLHRLEASIQPRNAPSRALVRRAGFVREGLSRRLVKIGGRWHDHERWAILAEEWRPLRRK